MTTNYDKYKDIISKLLMCNYMVTSSGKVAQCNEVEDNCDCNACIFNTLNHCDVDGKRMWLFDNYRPALSMNETIFIKMVEGAGWLARDKNGCLYLYCTKPTKAISTWDTYEEIDTYVQINEDYFEFIRWEDEEPVALSDIRTYYSDKDDSDDSK